MRERVQTAIESLGYRVTAGDVVARAGVKLSEADEALQALSCDSQGALEVSETRQASLARNLAHIPNVSVQADETRHTFMSTEFRMAWANQAQSVPDSFAYCLQVVGGGCHDHSLTLLLFLVREASTLVAVRHPPFCDKHCELNSLSWCNTHHPATTTVNLS